MSAIVEFTIPSVPPSLPNERTHWKRRAQVMRDWRKIVWAFATANRIGRVACISPATVSVFFTLPRGGDADNHVKPVLDGLVGAGLIQDDGPPHLFELRLRSRRGSPAQTFVRIEPARGGSVWDYPAGTGPA